MCNFKNKAWTLMELVICIFIIILISSFLIKNFKPAPQKARIFLYAAMKNLSQANALVIDKKSSLMSDPSENVVDDNDAYCLALADNMTLEKTPDCNKTNHADYKVNLVFPNGLSIMGLTSDWIVPYPDADYAYKNILVDVDGSKGKNQLFIDRFPLRVYDSGNYMGMVMPVNCGTSFDKVYDTEGNVIPQTINPYCKGKTVHFLSDNKILSYDIYRADSTEEVKANPSDEDSVGMRAFVKRGLLSPEEADCQAYGGYGMLTKYNCNALGIRILDVCTTEEICDECHDTTNGIDICPLDENDVPTATKEACLAVKNAKNPNDIKCFTYLHKPSGGANIMLNVALEEVDL